MDNYPHQRMNAFNAKRPIALPVGDVIKALGRHGVSPDEWEILKQASEDDWITMYPGGKVVLGIADDADMAAVGERLRQGPV